MTEKRFTLDEYYNIEDNYEQKIYHGGEDTDSILDLLNQLNDENEQLKFQLDECRNHKLFSRRELEKENEQLKSTMKEVAELLEEEVDLFSDKATEHDICAYIELNELDNKDAYYMATSTKKAIKMLKELEE